MSVNVVVIGAGGFGRETLDVIEAHNAAVRSQIRDGAALQVMGVADDLPSRQNLQRLEERGYPYLGTTEDVIKNLGPHKFVLAIGDPRIKPTVDNRFVEAGWKAVTVVHPSATVGSQCEFGEGSIICSGAQISTNSRLGRHVHVNPNATIGHDTTLAEFVSVNPGAVISGEVTVQRASLIGASSVILQGVQVGDFCVIGASACVVKDVVPNMTMIGVPARPMPLKSYRTPTSQSNSQSKR